MIKDSSRIETLAVTEVQRNLARTQHLDPNDIPVGDKGPSLDGHIIVYKTGKKTVENIDGYVPVQVKGKSVNSIDLKEIKYSVRISDLVNFLRVGGAIFFVVAIDEKDCKIFFYKFAPYDINILLEEVKSNQKTKSVTFQPFPTDPEEMATSIISFLHDCNKQALIKDGENKSIEKIQSNIDSDKLNYKVSFTGIGESYKEPFKFFLKHDTYLYIENTELNISFPIEKLERSDIVEVRQPVATYVGNKKYFDSCCVEYREGEEKIKLGSCISFLFENQKSTMSFRATGDLDSRLRGEEFLQDYFNKKDLRVAGKKVPFPFKDDDIRKNFDLKRLASEIDWLRAIKAVIEFYGVNDTLELNGLTDRDIETIKVLGKAKDNGKVKIKESIHGRIQRIKINNLYLILLFTEIDEGVYSISSFFDVEFPCKLRVEGEEMAINQYALLTVEDFSCASNINYRSIVKSIDAVQSEEHIDQMRMVLLRMLYSYDKNERSELLEGAIKLAREINKISGMDIDILNIVQCNMRKRSINKTEKKSLKKIIKDNNSNSEVVLGASILLGDVNRAESIYESLSEERKSEFNDYPICRFWKSHDYQS